MLYDKLKQRPRDPLSEKWPSQKLTCKTVTVVVQANTAGKQHVDVEFHPLLYVSAQLYP